MPGGGPVVSVQGFEPLALDHIFEHSDDLRWDDVLTDRKDVPEIWYTDENGIKRRHYVDIYIPKWNKCIEVKSEYTLHSELDTVLCKKEAGLEMGFDYDIYVFDKKELLYIM